MASEVEFGDYILDKSLGTGATGKVKLARHKTTGELVAVKIIKKGLFDEHPELLTKVQREVALMRLISHPNILPLHDVFESEHHILIVEGYAPNGSLCEYLNTLPAPAAVSIFRQIIYGLEYLHQHCICHRDLKPENILLDSAFQIWIADFGLACWMPNNVANTSCGSPLYSAPEIIRGVPYDGRRADVWSAGVILYAMLTASLPFYGDSVRVVAQKIKRGAYQIPPTVNKDLADLIKRILVVDPANRLTIEQIKEHRGFRLGLPRGYVVPTPLPLPHLEKPIELKEDGDMQALEVLQQVGFSDPVELKRQLTCDKANMAKVFYFMLTQKNDMATLPWDGAVGVDNTFLDHSFGNEPYGIMRDLVESRSIGSFFSPFESAVPLVPDQAGSDQYGMDESLPCMKIDSVHLGLRLQDFFRDHSFEFLVPDDRTMYARNEVTSLCVCLKAAYVDTETMSLKVHEMSGGVDQFQLLVMQLRIALQDLERGVGDADASAVCKST